MPQTITTGVKTLVAEANKLVKTLPLAEARTLYDNPEYVFVDLRDIREIQRGGMIPGAFSCPRGHPGCSVLPLENIKGTY